MTTLLERSPQIAGGTWCPPGVRLSVYQLRDGRYVEVADAEDDAERIGHEPFDVRIVPGPLAD